VHQVNIEHLARVVLEYGSTCAIFLIDEQTLRYLRLTGRMFFPPEERMRNSGVDAVSW
jgi:aconitase A